MNLDRSTNPDTDFPEQNHWGRDQGQNVMSTPLGVLHAIEKNDINKVASPNSTLLQLCYAIIYDWETRVGCR